MKKVVDYSVLVASGVIAAKGAMEGFKALKSKKYVDLAWISLGVAVAAYAFTYALDKAKSPKMPEVVVVEKIAAPEEGE